MSPDFLAAVLPKFLKLYLKIWYWMEYLNKMYQIITVIVLKIKLRPNPHAKNI